MTVNVYSEITQNLMRIKIIGKKTISDVRVFSNRTFLDNSNSVFFEINLKYENQEQIDKKARLRSHKCEGGFSYG